MPAFQRKYSDDQRTAVQQAWAERGIRPASRIVQLAADGELTCDGEIIPAFQLGVASARSIGEVYVRNLTRSASKAIAKRPADTVETLRRRFAIAIDAQLSDIERRQARRKYSSVKASELQGIGRMLRELAALPGAQGEPAQGKPPGNHNSATGKTDGGRTRGGLAGQLLATVEPRPIAAQDDTEQAEDDGDNARSGEPAISENNSAGAADQRINAPADGEESTEPGAYARAQIARMRSEPASPGA